MPTTPNPTQGITTCTRCGAHIRWATGPKGQRIPLNALPSPVGEFAAHTNGLGDLVVRRLTADRPKPGLLEWKAVVHLDSCTGISQQRRRPGRRRPNVQPPLWGPQARRGGR